MKCTECGSEYDEELDDCCPFCGFPDDAGAGPAAGTRAPVREEAPRVEYTRKELESFMEEEDNFPW